MIGVRRKVRDENDAQKLLVDWERSGLDISAFCARVGVDGRSLNCWRVNLGRREETKTAPPLRFLEVVGTQAAPRAEYRIRVGELVVEVDDDFREDTLCRILRAVRC